MKLLIASLAGLLAVSTAASIQVEFVPQLTLDDVGFSVEERFEKFVEMFEKTYESVDEKVHAALAFASNDEIIRKHNAGDHSFKLGHNEFSDLTWPEFKKLYVTGMASNPSLRRAKNYDHSLKTAPADDSVDWEAKGAVTPIKNQAHCGSCWAFSTTGGLEGAIFVKHGVLESLSEEELVQCDKVDHGCQGGAMDNGFSFIKKKGGIATEEQYPYTSATGAGKTGSCVSSKESPVAKYTDTVSGFTDVTPNSETALKAAVKMHPVSVAIEADKQVFQFYKTGVLKASAGCGTKLDHGVLAVGYGVDAGTMYWKVKNSWGPTWGDQGYIKLERKESTSGAGTCGIAMDASYPKLS